jgi:hypothetical protein
MNNYLEECLLQQKTVTVQNLVSFCTVKAKPHNQSSSSVTFTIPKYALHGTIKKVIVTSVSQTKSVNNASENKELYKEVGSLLFIESSIIEQVITIFVKAIYDLVCNGKEVELDLHFCILTLCKDKGQCSFRKPFIEELKYPKGK